MKIGFEVSNAFSKEPTGVANYIKNSIEAIADLNGGHELKLFYKASRLKHKKNSRLPNSIPSKIYQGSIFPPFKSVDIIHGLDAFVPNWRGVKRIVTFHDIYPFMNRDEIVSPKDFRLKKEAEYSKAALIANAIITVSESTKSDVIDYFQVPESKVFTVHSGVDSDFFRKKNSNEINEVKRKYGINKPYLLFVGSVSGRKNTANLVEAFALSNAQKDFDLVLAGSVVYMGDHTLNAIKHNGLTDKIKILSYVENQHLPALYSGAKGFLFTTMYEGFGFPILEAMLCEVPVLTSDVGSAPEIGGDFAEYANPQDIDSIKKGIDRIVGNSEMNLVGARNHAMKFSWETAAKRMLEIYDKTLQK